MNIAIFNSFPFHYEMFGYIIEYCIYKNYKLTIYTETKNDYEYLNWYKNFFKNDFTYKLLNDFDPYNLNYSFLFLTTDDDKHFKNEWYSIIKIPIISIDHSIIHRNMNTYYNILVRPLKKRKYTPYIIPSFRINNNKTKYDMIKNNKEINIVIVGCCNKGDKINWKSLDNIINVNKNIKLSIIGRTVCQKFKKYNCEIYNQIDTQKMFEIINNSNYLLLCKYENSEYIEDQFSGSISLAMSTCTPIIMPEKMKIAYNFKSSIGYTESNIPRLSNIDIYNLLLLVKKDQNDIINKRNQIFDAIMYPNPIPYIAKNKEIPKNINFIWIDKNDKNCSKIPTKNNIFLQTWKIYNPTYNIKIWYEKDIDKLLSNVDKKYSTFFYNIKTTICKCDFMRFFIIYLFGGIYSDLDFYCLQSFDSLIKDKSYLIFEEPPEHEKQSNNKLLFNGIFASYKNNPFLLGWIDSIIKNWKEPIKSVDVMNTTGPIGFYKYYEKNPIILSNTCDVMPIINNNTVSSICDKNKKPYAVTLWKDGTSWGVGWAGDNENFINIIGNIFKPNNNKKSKTIIVIILLILFIAICIFIFFFRKKKLKKYYN